MGYRLSQYGMGDMAPQHFFAIPLQCIQDCMGGGERGVVLFSCLWSGREKPAFPEGFGEAGQTSALCALQRV